MKKNKNFKVLFIAALQTIILCVFTAMTAYAKDYNFSWSANPEPIEGYRLYYKKGGTPIIPFDGTAATEGQSPIDVGKVTEFTLSGLEDNTTYYFTLTAYNGDTESEFADIISVFPSVNGGSQTPVITAIRYASR